MHRLLAVLVTLFQVARSDAFQHTLARTRCTHVRRFNRIHGGGGGGGGSGGGISDTSGGEPQPVFRSWVLLASTYSAIIAAKTTLPVTLESLLRSGAAGSGFERLPYRSTMAIIAGKLVLGPITNMMGPFRFLAAVLMCMGACCALCGASTGGGFFSLVLVELRLRRRVWWNYCSHSRRCARFVGRSTRFMRPRVSIKRSPGSCYVWAHFGAWSHPWI